MLAGALKSSAPAFSRYVYNSVTTSGVCFSMLSPSRVYGFGVFLALISCGMVRMDFQRCFIVNCKKGSQDQNLYQHEPQRSPVQIPTTKSFYPPAARSIPVQFIHNSIQTSVFVLENICNYNIQYKYRSVNRGM